MECNLTPWFARLLSLGRIDGKYGSVPSRLAGISWGNCSSARGWRFQIFHGNLAACGVTNVTYQWIDEGLKKQNPAVSRFKIPSSTSPGFQNVEFATDSSSFCGWRVKGVNPGHTVPCIPEGFSINSPPSWFSLLAGAKMLSLFGCK